MPRRAQTSSSGNPKRLKQKSLDTFFPPSSPILVQASPSPSPKVSHSRISTRRKETNVAKKRGSTKRKPVVIDEILDTDDDNNSNSDPGRIRFETEAPSASESDEDNVKSSPQKSKLSQTIRRRRMADSEEEDDNERDTEDEEEKIGVPVVWKGKARDGKRRRIAVHSDSDEEPQPRKRKLIKGVRPPTPEDDLLDEVDESKIMNSRLRSRDKRSLYLQNLDKIRKRKRGESVTSVSSETDTDPADSDMPFAHAKPHTKDTEDEDESEQADDEELDGFIEDDGNAVTPTLPPEFSMNTFQDLMHHFKIICQLFVHLAVQQRKDRRAFMERSLKDQYFSLPLQIARRKLEGMRDSLVTSSIWRPLFKKVLSTYPEFEAVQLAFALPGCDACHLGGRQSTLVGRVSGEPYDRKTFLPLSRGDESSESDDSDNEEGSTSKKEFNLGRFCANRTRVYHMFTHWEYSLFKTLSEEVEGLQQRHSGKPRVFVRVAYAGGIKPPDDLTDADGIMSWLDERGIIACEWQKIKGMMEEATHLEMAMKRGNDAD